ncbi:MAG: hypothetical protein NXI12_14220 [Alphaproteobacteria bacterium]|nr:hypothetical protein [Alphaproteobacteria bacterium]
MVDISAYAPSFAAVEAARTSTASAVNVATSYGERPTFRDDAVTAASATRAMTSKISRLNEMRALERVDGLLDVTLAATDTIVDTLTEMKTLAARLQDQSLSDDMRATLTNEYSKLLPRIDELTEMASFGGRNLINPDASQISGDLELPGGQVVEAKDLRNWQGQILALSGGGQGGSGGGGSSAQAPFLDDLAGAFTFDGSLSQLGIGTDSLTANAQGSVSFNLAGGVGGIFLNTGSRLVVSGPAKSSQSFFATIESGNFGSWGGVNVGNDEVRLSAISDPQYGTGLQIETNISGQYNVGTRWGPINTTNNIAITYQNLANHTTVNVYFNGTRYQIVAPSLPFQANALSEFIFEGALEVNDVAIYNRSMSGTGVSAITTSMTSGVENWVSGSGGGSGGGSFEWDFEWDAVHAALDVSLSNVLAAQADYGGAARSAELKAQVQQRMVDAIDSATARLVNRDIDRLGALRAAGEVREQLAQAMMQSQTTTLSAQTSLFSNALGLFDAMNIGGFRPMGLETAGARGGL